MMNPTTTLAKIRAFHPCSDGWSKLLTGLGYRNGDFDPARVVSLGDIATTNDAADALWAVRALDWSDVAVRRAAIAGAVLPAVKRSVKYTTDHRAHEAVAELDRWCSGDDTVDLEATRRKAAYAARAAYAAAAAYAAYAAYAAAAYAAVYAARAADAAEREQQRADIIAAFPPVALDAAVSCSAQI